VTWARLAFGLGVAAFLWFALAAQVRADGSAGNNTTLGGNGTATTNTSNATLNGCGSIALVNGAPTGSNSCAGGNAAFPVGPNTFLTNGDAAAPYTGWSTFPSAFYDPATKVVWVGTSGSNNGSTRDIYVATYNLQSGTWSPGPNSQGYVVQANANSDGHGAPGLVMDQYGYVHSFCCGHAGNISYSWTTGPRNPASWTAGTAISGQYTFYQPTLYNGTIYLFTLMTTANGAGTEDIAVFTGTPSPSGGVASWSGPTQLTNFSRGVFSFAFMGNVAIRGNLLCFPFTYSIGASSSSAYDNDVYYACYNPATGALQDITGANIVASGSLPITRSTAQSEFEVVASTDTSHSTTNPVQAVDANGVVHILYANGLLSDASPGAGSFPILEAYSSGGAWTTGVAIGCTTTNWLNFPAIVATGSGNGVRAYCSPSDTIGVAASTTLGTWGSFATIPLATNGTAWAAVTPFPLFNGPPQALALLLEVDNISGQYWNSAVALYGENGLIPIGWNFINSDLVGYWTFDSSQCSGSTTNDSSGNGNNGTLSGLTCANEVTAQIAQGFQFVATQNYIDFGNSSTLKPATPLTVSFWVDVTAYEASTSIFFGNDDGAAAITVCRFSGTRMAPWWRSTATAVAVPRTIIS
jgi:hypothetical protein